MSTPTPSPALDLNPRVAAMQPSATLAMTARAKELKRAGRPVVSLSAGEPDFDTPAPIRAAAERAIEGGWTHYTENAGLPDLRQAICDKLARDNDLHYAPEDILVSNGAKQSIALVIAALCREGDEVLVPAPYWVSYPEMIRFAGATPTYARATAEDDYKLTPEALEAALTPRTRMVLLCSPSNPTGAVYSRDEMEALAAVLRRHEHVWVLSDEIYEYIVYDAEHVAFASLPGMRERTITVNGFSKGYAMTGWRLGYLAAERAVTKAAAKIQGQFTSAPSTISQKAGIAALEMPHGEIETMVRAFRERRDYVLSRLATLPDVVCPRPEGAFYVFPQIAAYFGRTAPDGRSIETSDDLAMYLLEAHDLALVAGSAFGDPEGIRLSYAASMADLETAMDRLEKGLAALRA